MHYSILLLIYYTVWTLTQINDRLVLVWQFSVVLQYIKPG